MLGIGIVVSVLMSFFSYRLIGLSFREELKIWARFGPHVFVIFLLLVRDIVKAAIQMVRIILSPTIEIKPQIRYFNSPVKSGVSKILLLYYIILTPGSVMFELEGDRVGVHAIDPSLAQIDDSDFVKKLKKIEGGQPRV